MYLLQLYLVTMETFVVQRNRSSPPSMGTPHLRTHFTNKKWKPCARRVRAAVPRTERLTALLQVIYFVNNCGAMFSTERLKISKSTWIKYLLEINFASSVKPTTMLCKSTGTWERHVMGWHWANKCKNTKRHVLSSWWTKNIYFLSRVGPRDCFGEAGQINGSKFPSPIPHSTHQQNNLVYTKTVDSIFRAQMLWMKM